MALIRFHFPFLLSEVCNHFKKSGPKHDYIAHMQLHEVCLPSTVESMFHSDQKIVLDACCSFWKCFPVYIREGIEVAAADVSAAGAEQRSWPCAVMAASYPFNSSNFLSLTITE